MRIIKYTVLALLFTCNLQAAILFEDNFNDHSDWSPTQQEGDQALVQAQDGDNTTACTGCPDGTAKYAGYFVDKSAWADYVGNNTLNIGSTNARGGTGKALTVWQEPIDSMSYCGAGWCSDGQLAVILDDTYDELYIRFYIKFQSGWVWDSTNGNANEKFVHISHFHDPPGSMWTFFTGASGSHHPVFIFNFKWPEWGGGGERAANSFSPRYQATYYPTQATPPMTDFGGINGEEVYVDGGTGTGGDKLWEEYVGDNDWHQVIVHVKGNTQGGYYSGDPNGEYSLWVDGELIHNRNNLAWADDTDADNTWTPAAFNGWNWFSIGGNAYNRYYNISSHTEQWYAIDDVVVATTYSEAVNGTTAPYYSSGEITAAGGGDVFASTWSENCTDGGLDGGECSLDCSVSGSVGLTYSSGDGTATWNWATASTINFGETCTFGCTLEANEIENGASEDMVTFSGGAVTNNTPDTTNPVPVIATSDPTAISVDSLIISGSSSDNDAVVGCKWRLGSAPDADNGTACTGTTSFSCNTSGYDLGANTAYVGCYDNADNYGSDSITVNYSTETVNGIVCGNNGSVACGNNGSVN